MLALTGAYGDGLNCMQGMQQALGQSLPNAEAEWHTSVLGEDASLTAFTNLFPYLATLVIVLTVAMVSAFTTRRPHK